ncbi:MAG: ATP-dependent Clp protease proteolytic subunit [Endomicrobiaceae bacterium]|jgi:ATP-dependent Clp protease protease subunit|nr:ATP-dependent Clp protease proteolytic subunit [Endomicrobiaceae bacterium]
MRKELEAFDDEYFKDVGVLMDTRLPEPTMLEYYQRLRNREILWNEDISEDTIMIANHIIAWNREDENIPTNDRKPIRIWINSDGGDANTVMHIIDVIKLSKTPVITIGMGKVYSAGGLLLMSGHKRLIFENTCCLIHDGYSGTFGTVGKVIDNIEFQKRLEHKMKEFIINQTKITDEEYEKNYRRDWFMFSDEIIKYGIADEIITQIDPLM